MNEDEEYEDWPDDRIWPIEEGDLGRLWIRDPTRSKSDFMVIDGLEVRVVMVHTYDETSAYTRLVATDGETHGIRPAEGFDWYFNTNFALVESAVPPEDVAAAVASITSVFANVDA